MNQTVRFDALGQSGYLMSFQSEQILFDPYISNSLEKSAGLKPMFTQTVDQENLKKSNYIFISHAHDDHFDKPFIIDLLHSNPDIKIIAPLVVINSLHGLLNSPNLIIADPDTSLHFQTFSVQVIDSAHPQHSYTSAKPDFVGYIFDFSGLKIYHAGDTGITDKLINALLKQQIHTAFIPVNEQNYFKNKEGIIGNMSVREALRLAELLEVKNLVPTHWDMFKNNSVHKEEIVLLYNSCQYDYQLLFYPRSL